MIKNIGAGWAEINFTSENNADPIVETASYLTDIPIDVLETIKWALENGAPATLFFDCEGYEIHILLSHYESFLISNKEEDCSLYRSNKNIEYYAIEICNDIKQDLDNWANWGYEDYEPEILEKRKEIIIQLIEDILKLLEKEGA